MASQLWEYHHGGHAPPSGEFVEGPQPGEPEGGDNPPPVDLVGARPPDRAVERPLAHGRGQGLPPLGGERLGVGQAGGRVGGARGCEGDADCDGAGQGAPAHLVDTEPTVVEALAEVEVAQAWEDRARAKLARATRATTDALRVLDEARERESAFPDNSDDADDSDDSGAQSPGSHSGDERG